MRAFAAALLCLASVAHAQPAGYLQLPAGELRFLELVEGFIAPYRAAPNELKKSALRTERARKVREAIGPGTRFEGWLGRLRKMSTTGDGDAVLEVSLGNSAVRLVTMNNALSDARHRTLIKQGTPLYNAVAELKVGDVVEVSGDLVLDKGGRDHLRETSLTEQGAMTEPEYLARFASVRKK